MRTSAIPWLVVSLAPAAASCSLLFDLDNPAATDAAPASDVGRSLDAGAQGKSFPPPGRTIRLVDGVVGDINGDGHTDIALANAPGDAVSDGVFVLFGPQRGPDLQFHHFIPSAVPPTAIAIGPGALGQSSGEGTLFIAGRAASGGSIGAFIYHKDMLDFVAADPQATSNGSAPSAIMPGNYDRIGPENDLMVAAGMGINKFYNWEPEPNSDPPTATGESFDAGAILALGLIEGNTDDELVAVFQGPSVLWRYHSSAGPLSVDARVDGTCGPLLQASAAQRVVPIDQLVDIVAASETHLCTYTLFYMDGRRIEEYVLEFAGSTLTPSNEGYEDILAVNLSGASNPEIVLLDTDNLAGTVIYFIRDVSGPPGGITNVLSHKGEVPAALPSNIAPSFLLALDFDESMEQKEVWAFDSQGKGFTCLLLEDDSARPCW